MCRKGIAIYINNKLYYIQNVDGEADKTNIKRIKILAKNDGFDSVDDFFKWFDKDFNGKIIHWTNKKY